MKVRKEIFKNAVLLILGVFLLAFFLFKPASVSGFTAVGTANVLLTIPAAIIALFLLLILLVSWGFVLLTGFILDVVMSPSFISLSYTNPANNQIIESGLNVTQSFVNMLLVLALVYIALSIALRLNETRAKKMLAKLIIVALLVNFVPVFCGLVVDASNITMDYFLRPIQGGASGILTQMGVFVDMLVSSIWKSITKILNNFGTIMMIVTQIILNFGAGMAFLLLAGIFLVRYVAIWILVISAPLAFVCWALSEGPIPQIRKMWNMWLDNFIQWSIIGIPIAFFLYLSMSTFTLMTAVVFNAKIQAPQIGNTASGFFNAIFPYFVVLIFLYAGFIFGLSTSAMGANIVINTTRKAGRWARGTGLKAVHAGMSSKWAEKTRLKERLIKGSYAPLPGIRGKPLGKKLLIGAGYASGAIPAYWAVRRGFGQGALKLTKSRMKDIKKAEDKYKGTAAEEKASAIRKPQLDPVDRIAALKQAIEEGQVDDLKKLGITNNEIKNIGRAALKIHPNTFKIIRDTFPYLAEDMGKGFSEEVQKKAKVHSKEAIQKGYSSVMEEIIAKMSPARVSKMDSSIFDPSNPRYQEALKTAKNYWTSQHWAKAGENFGKSFTDVIREEFQRHPEQFTPSAQRYFISSPAGTSLYGTGKIIEKKKSAAAESAVEPGATEVKKAPEEEKKAVKERTKPINVIEAVKEKFKKKKEK